jgi:hypothetical protein
MRVQCCGQATVDAWPAIADVITFAVTRPRRMILNEILLRPTNQPGGERRMETKTDHAAVISAFHAYSEASARPDTQRVERHDGHPAHRRLPSRSRARICR